MNETRRDLFELRGTDVRRDPALKFVLESRQPDVRMRGALSILIGYWCLEFKLEDYFTGDLGLYGLGIESISFGKSQEGTKMFTSTEEKRAGDPNALAKEDKGTAKSNPSTIVQLINVPSITRLAEEIIHYPGIVAVAEEFLETLKNVPSSVPDYLSYFPHRFCTSHRLAVRAFWRNEDFCELLLRHAIKDPFLLAIMKIFSYRSTREIALRHSEFILQSYDSESFFTNQNCDLEQKIRLALAILFEHWTCMGVLMNVRKNIRFYYDHSQTTKKYAKFNDKPNREIIFRPVCAAGSLTEFLSHWNEENQTEINHLLEKDLSKVLTGWYIADGTMTDLLLDKIKHKKPDDSPLRMELKNLPGLGLTMTCSFSFDD